MMIWHEQKQRRRKASDILYITYALCVDLETIKRVLFGRQQIKYSSQNSRLIKRKYKL